MTKPGSVPAGKTTYSEGEWQREQARHAAMLRKAQPVRRLKPEEIAYLEGAYLEGAYLRSGRLPRR